MIRAEHVQEVIDSVNGAGLSEQLMGELRNKYEYHFTYCMQDDMDAYTPAMECGAFNIYFVDSSNHCSKLTSDSSKASGFVLAEVLDDD